MSTSDSHIVSESEHAGEGSPWRRDNWHWDERDDGPPRETPGVTNDPAEQIAHKIMRRFREPLCKTHAVAPPWNGGRMAELFAWLFEGECIEGRGEALHHENRHVELTDPDLYLPPADGPGAATEYHAARYNPETGYVGWGETTGTYWADGSEDELLTMVVDHLARTRPSLRDEYRDDVLDYVRRLKRQGDHSDLQILIRTVRHIRNQYGNGVR